MSFRELMVMVVAVIIFALIIATPITQAADKPERHHPDRGSCIGCHKEDAERSEFTAKLEADCIACHQAQGVEVDVAAVRETDPEPAVNTGNPKRGKGPGMVVPVYYQDTRIGAEPHDMVPIPGGEFIMGTDSRLPDEGPRHTASVEAFLIDKYEVTNLQYKAFIDETGRRSPRHFRNRTFPRGKADHPVTFVSWHDAKAYCAWAGKRLPSEEEWEKAARGADGRMFPWGDEFGTHKANTPERWGKLGVSRGDTTPVGAFPQGQSPYGVMDMSGNVWEWTSSWYKPHPGNQHPSEPYGEKYKVLKGGSWRNCSFYQCGMSAPVFNRSFFNPRTNNQGFGFRCAKDGAEHTG